MQAPGREVPLSLTPQEIDTVVQALGQMPYFQVAGTIQKVVRQVQDAAKADAEAVRTAAGAEAPS